MVVVLLVQCIRKKKTSSDCTIAISIAASNVRGRNTSLQLHHIHSLVTQCSNVMGIVEEIRLRILACPGLVGKQRAMRLNSISYPYTDGEELILNADADTRVGSRAVIEMVSEFNCVQKDRYALEILEKGIPPMRSARTAKAVSMKQST